MRSLHIGFLGCLLSMGINCSHAITLSNIVDQVSTDRYSNVHLNLYTSDGNNRGFTISGATRYPAHQHDLARDYIASNFNAMGFVTLLDPFSFTFDGARYTNCNNVVGIKYGTIGSDIHIIGAHYDSVDLGQPDITSENPYFPGADDNGSGVAGLLETAHVIHNYTFKDTIILIAFDAEEKGFIGSHHFVNNRTTTNTAETNDLTFLRSAIKGMLSVDMIGYDDPSNGQAVVIGRRAQANLPLADRIAAAANQYSALSVRQDYFYNSSDHMPFHDAGIPAVHIIEHDLQDYWNSSPPFIENPHYHSNADSRDSPNYLSYAYASEVTRCLVGYLCNEANVIPPADLIPTLSDANTLTVQWQGAPNVAYNIEVTGNLMSSNGWTIIQQIPATNISMDLSVELSTQSATQQMMRVIAE